MKWSWQLGKVGGTTLRIHITFLLLLAWVAFTAVMAGHSAGAIVSMASFVIALFAAVLLHELGHLIAAWKFRLPVAEITLFPIGGFTPPARALSHLENEIRAALAGPAANAMIAALLGLWLFAMHQWEPISHLKVATGPFIERLFLANIWLVFFNLIPAAPMDGGRVLRALMATRMSYAQATQLVAVSGQGLALLLGFVGLFASPLLLFAAMFIWIGANEEYYAAQMTSALSATPVSAIMLTRFGQLQATDTLAVAVRLTLAGENHDFPVVSDGQVTGILTRTDLLVALAEFGQDYPVSKVMRQDFAVAAGKETLNAVFRRVHNCDCHTTPVMQDGRLAGLITMEHLGEYLLIESKSHKNGIGLNRRRRTPQPALHTLRIS